MARDQRHTNGPDEVAVQGPPQRAHVTKRDLCKINVHGKKPLTEEEITAVNHIAGDLWPAVKTASLTRQDLKAAAVHGHRCRS